MVKEVISRLLLIVAWSCATACTPAALTVRWDERDLVRFEKVPLAPPAKGPRNGTALTCWQAGARVEHAGFFVMPDAAGDFGVNVCARTSDLDGVRADSQRRRVPVRIDVAGKNDLIHAQQILSPACVPRQGTPIEPHQVRLAESWALVLPVDNRLKLKLDTVTSVFVQVVMGDPEDAVTLVEERGVIGELWLQGEPPVTAHGSLRCGASS